MRRVVLLISFVASIWPTSASASVWINASASPNPFGYGATINVTVSASWDQHPYFCTWPATCWPESYQLAISGSDGFYQSLSGNLNGGTSGFWQFSDSTPGQTMDGVSYSIDLTINYLDYEMWWWYSDNGNASTSANPMPPSYVDPTVVRLQMDSSQSVQ